MQAGALVRDKRSWRGQGCPYGVARISDGVDQGVGLGGCATLSFLVFRLGGVIEGRAFLLTQPQLSALFLQS
jgi:hypothetical protein